MNFKLIKIKILLNMFLKKILNTKYYLINITKHKQPLDYLLRSESKKNLG